VVNFTKKTSTNYSDESNVRKLSHLAVNLINSQSAQLGLSVV